MDIQTIREKFTKHLGGEATAVYASPGRINLIGDYRRAHRLQWWFRIPRCCRAGHDLCLPSQWHTRHPRL